VGRAVLRGWAALTVSSSTGRGGGYGMSSVELTQRSGGHRAQAGRLDPWDRRTGGDVDVSPAVAACSQWGWMTRPPLLPRSKVC
jgi:hypothetical protein